MIEPRSTYEIALEGPDNGGKTTLIGVLSDHYESQGLRVARLLGLSNTVYGREIRKNLLNINAMGLQGIGYFKEDIRRTYEDTLYPQSPQLVFWDRHMYSIAAANSLGEDLEAIRQVKPIIPEPQRVVLLDVPEEISLEREKAAGKTDHPLTIEWAREKRARYLRIAANEPDLITVIDTMQPINDVREALIRIINQDLIKYKII